MDFKAGEIFVNDDKGVTALQFIADLVVKHKVTPPEVTTWEFDEIIAGGQRDRYVMAQTFAPYMTLINDPGLSKTGGNWSAALVPGYTDKSQSRSWVDGHFLAVPKYARNAGWSIEFIRMACSKKWQLRSMERGNAPPRGSVLNDATMAEKLGWPPTAARSIETGVPTPAHPVWTTLELTLRSGVPKRCRARKPRRRRSTPWPPTGSAHCAAPASGAPERPNSASAAGERRASALWRFSYCAAAFIGTCALRKRRTLPIVRSFSSGGSRHGNTVISALGASEATSIEVCSGWAGVSSGSTSIGVWQFLMNSRGTL